MSALTPNHGSAHCTSTISVFFFFDRDPEGVVFAGAGVEVEAVVGLSVVDALRAPAGSRRRRGMSGVSQEAIVACRRRLSRLSLPAAEK